MVTYNKNIYLCNPQTTQKLLHCFSYIKPVRNETYYLEKMLK